jgi:hypothetical protein
METKNKFNRMLADGRLTSKSKYIYPARVKTPQGIGIIAYNFDDTTRNDVLVMLDKPNGEKQYFARVLRTDLIFLNPENIERGIV